MSEQEKQARDKQTKPLAETREQRLSGAEAKAKGRGKPEAAEAVAALAAVVEGKEPEGPAPVPPARFPFLGRPAVRQAGALGLMACLGALVGVGAMAAFIPVAPAPAPVVIAGPDWTKASIFGGQAEPETRRVAADLRALRGSVDGLKDGIERGRQEASQRAGQATDRLDRLQRADQDSASRLAAVAERLERMEKDQNPRLGEIAARLDRIEKQLASVPTAAAPKAAEPSVTGSVVEKTPPKKAPIEGWVLREVYDGSALVEGRNRRLREIAPGQTLPGAGKIESIERRGRTWVVVTDRGIITSQQW
jgi:hypothetical protein